MEILITVLLSVGTAFAVWALIVSLFSGFVWLLGFSPRPRLAVLELPRADPRSPRYRREG